MIGTYVSAALICAASLLVGRALLVVAGREAWSWLAPAAGFGAILTVTGVLARAPGHGTSATLGLALLVVVAAAVVLWARPPFDREALRQALPVALVIAIVLSIPFAITARWGLLGVGFNNDLGLHLAWAEWLRGGAGPTPEPGYPLGPHGLAVAVAAVPGIGLGQAFVGEIFAIGVLTGLTALGALGDLRPGRRLLAAVLVAVSYLGASYFAQGAFKETAEALFVLAFAVGLFGIDRSRRRSGPRRGDDASPSDVLVASAGRVDAVAWIRLALPYLALAGGIFFAYSFAGLAWPLAILVLWSLTLPPVRAALAPRRLLRLLLRPATLAAIAVLAGLGVAATLVGPFGFVHTFNKVAGTNTYGPVSPIEALGVWPASNYRLDAPGGAKLPALAGAIGALAVALGALWWARRRELAVPLALGACALLYLASLPFSGDYSQAKALMIGAPLAMLVAVRPLLVESAGRGRGSSRQAAESSATLLPRLGWAALAVLFVGGAAYSSLLALREAPVGPAGHGGELRAFLPIVHGKPVLYAGQDRYAAYELMGADTHVPIVEFPDPEVSENPEKPFDTGDAYSPIDFDSFSRGTLDRVPYVVTGRAAWNSKPPPNFRRVAATESYLLWERTGETPEDRHVLLEGTDAGAWAGCASPEIRILLASGGRAALFPTPAIGRKEAWREGHVLGVGETASQEIELPAGRWRLSLQYFSPFELTLSAPGFRRELKAALDGQRPNTISLANDGQFWPVGEIVSRGGRVRFEIAAAEPTTLQRLSGYAGKAQVGSLVAVPAEPHRTVPLAQACDEWIDWYESEAAP
ncbi:MAG TPA: hypothetical protein VEQ41_09760 [Solirubrobacterales bacterium]|nr:hypothetical protein [Solirubrobacterales bacterium]